MRFSLLAILIGIIVIDAKVTQQFRSFMGQTGGFGSPAFPDIYPNEFQDTAVIQLGDSFANYVIHIEFLVFQLENGYDTVDIFDGNSTESALNIGKLTGNMTGRTYQSDGPTLTILFKTDLTGQRDGFYVRWNAVKKGDSYSSPKTCDHLLIMETTGYGLIYSPGYVGNYPDSITCNWTLEAGIGQKVLVIFYSYETEDCYDTFTSDLTKNYAGFSAVFRYVSASETINSDFNRMDWTPSEVKRHPKDINPSKIPK
ncbi:hypothetical protein PRIPAC_72700 [Pristionchus pacificus]|uniref:CUB domain-containing protein n=1 Tax=Pristionchus pacificus TaxID=54126 RepID=A0A2A6CAM7_PRIPA|nr:hypothetical protein PRIPAC_72700 [Pristionchus pacificus]|eukprot:PDM75177.1 CUB domain-containing protein [Pristionchus pacificus]